MSGSVRSERLPRAPAAGLSDADFAFLQGFLLRKSGSVLWAEKRYFANLRMGALAAQTGHPGTEELIAAIRKSEDSDLASRAVEAMTINETYFFRDVRPFELIENVVLPQLLKRRAGERHLRIWCAAVSSGQEAYSVAMLLRRHAEKLKGWRINILGTDISREVIEKARSGRYSHFEVQRGLPIKALLDNFTQVGDAWEVSSALRDMVEFKVLNLMTEMHKVGEFDIVLLRNVLIYLDMRAKANVLARVAGHLAPNGCVFLGSAESTLGLGDALVPDPVERGIYVRPARAHPDLSRRPG